MKRVLAWVLLLVMVLGMFAGCKPAEDTTPTTEPSTTAPQGTGIQDPGAQDAIDYLKSLYQDDGAETAVDFNRYGIIRVGGIEFTITWSTDVAEELVKVVTNEDGTVTIDINEQCEEATPYKLIATITDANGNVATHTWNYTLPKAQDMVEIVKAAYALGKGESLPYQSRLIGKIISIDAIWTDEYQNITVTIAVEGAEDMPIKCYRMKATDNTLAVIKDLLVGNIITVIGTLKNYEGTIEFDAGCLLEKVEKGDAKEALTDPGEILKAAYALKKGESLPNPATLTGTVIAIDSPYDPQYGNISVVIEVEGYPQYPMLCYRLKGTGVDEIAVDDLITVSGIIKNYNGKIEYDAGCMMLERVSGGGVAQKPSSDAAKILADAAKLKPGESLPYRATLTGEIVSVDNAYSAQYANVTVTMKVNGMKIQCYRMVGDGIDQIRETDTITVSGVIKNYNGKLEFDTKCNLDSWTKGPRNVNYGPVKEDVAYRLYMDQKATGNTVYFNGEVKSNRLQTTTTGSKGVDVYAERHSKGLRFFYMDGETKTYIEIEEFTNDEGKQRGGLKVTTEPTCYWVYNSDCGVYIVNLPTAGKYFLGTYGTYETISASWIGYIDGSYSGGSTQYVAKFIEASKVQDGEPSDTIVQGTAVENPVVGTAYKFGYYQNQVDGKPFLAFSGKKDGYYYGTADTIAKMVDVYLEEAEGGYHIYFLDGSTKTYLDLTPRDDDATKVNTVLQTSGKHTVWSLNLEHKYVYATEVGSEWYLGTFGTNTSISASLTSFISDTSKIGVSQFCAWFSEVEEVEAPEEPTEPTDPPTTEPGNAAATVVIYNPSSGKALSSNPSRDGSFYLGGVDVTVNGTTVTGYGATEQWELIDNGDGTYSFSYNGKKLAMGSQYSSTPLGEVNDDWKVIDAGNGLYYIENTGRADNRLQWRAETYNYFSCYYKDNTGDAYKFAFYVVSGTLPNFGGSTEPDVTEPEATEPQVTEPGNTATTVVIYNPSSGKALSSNPSRDGSFYLGGVDVTVNGTTVTGYGATEQWELIDNGDGTYSFSYNGKKLAMGSQYSSTPLGEVNDDWKVIDAGNGLYYIENTGRADNRLQWRAETYNYFSCYYKDNTGDAYKFAFYVVSGKLPNFGGSTEPDVTEPEVTEPQVTEPGNTATTVVIYNPSSGKALSSNPSRDGSFYLGGVDVTVNGTTVTGYGATEQWELIDNGDGTYSFSYNGKKLAMGSQYSSTPLGEVNDDWKVIDAGNGLYYIENTGRADNRLQWRAETYNYFSCYYKDNTGDAYKFAFYVVSGKLPNFGGSTDPDVTEPEATEPPATEPGVTGNGYIKVTSADQFTTGKYVMIVSTGYAPGVYDNTWLSAVQPVVSGNTVTDTKGAVWTLTVNGSSVTITDANGVVIKPKGGNNNGVAEGDYDWAWSFENGTFKFAGIGSDTVIMASNTSTTGQHPGNHRFRGYKTTTVSSQAANYPCNFTLYKLSETTGEEPEVTEPQVTEPEVTEPEVTEPAGYVAISEALAATSGNFTVKGVVTALEGTNIYIQDATGAICVRLSAAPSDVSLGDTIIGSGSRGTYNGLPQLNNGSYEKSSGLTLTAKETTISALTKADICAYVKISNVTVTEVYDNNGAYTAPNITVEDEDGNKIQIYKAVVGKTGGEWDVKVGDVITVTAAVGYHNKFQLRNTLATEIVVGEGGDPEVTEPEVTEPEATEPSAGSSVTYTFSNYTKTEQYVDCTVELDAMVTLALTNSGCMIDKQLRVYQDDKGHDGKAIFTCTKAIQSLVINAGYKVSSLEVYGSDDGVTWTKVTTVSVTSTSYGDYNVEMPAGTSYKYLKLDAVGAQVRIPYITFNFA